MCVGCCGLKLGGWTRPWLPRELLRFMVRVSEGAKTASPPKDSRLLGWAG